MPKATIKFTITFLHYAAFLAILTAIISGLLLLDSQWAWVAGVATVLSTILTFTTKYLANLVVPQDGEGREP